MKQPSHRERLISSLPADMQAGALEACHAISDDAIEAMFSVDVEATQRGFSEQRERTQRSTAQLREEIRILREKLAESDERHRGELTQSKDRENKLLAEIAKTQQKVMDLSGDLPWWRGKIKTAVNGIVWCLSVVACTTFLRYTRLEDEAGPMRKVVAEHQKITATLSNDPASLAEFAKYTKEANSEALQTAGALHAINKLMTLPKMQMYRSDDGFLMITGPKAFMPVGTTEDGRNWVKLANPAARISNDTTPAIDNAKEAEKKLNPSK
jgi:hypothetical protein